MQQVVHWPPWPMGAEMRIPGERPAMNPIASDDLLNHVRASFVLWDATDFSVVESFPYSVEDFRVRPNRQLKTAGDPPKVRRTSRRQRPDRERPRLRAPRSRPWCARRWLKALSAGRRVPTGSPQLRVGRRLGRGRGI